MNRIKGFRVHLYKHAGTDYSNGGTSSRTDQVLVVDVVTRESNPSTYRRHGLPEAMRRCAYRSGDHPMVLLHRPGPCRPVLYDARVTDRGELLVANWGMASGVFADDSDNRWRELVGGPVDMHDRHEWPVRWCPTEGK